MRSECGCSEDYGPCEQHGTVLAQRDGAAVRTADELARVFIDDATDIGAELSSYGADVVAAADAEFATGERWLTADAGEALLDLVHQVEATLDAWVIWEDGYCIVRPSADCPLLDY